MAQTISSTGSFSSLDGHQYISLTTFRKNGQPVPTPVWFAHHNGKLVLFTLVGTGKLKRLVHTSRVTVAPCTMSGKLLGEAVEGTARILTAPAERKAADDTLNRKYGLMKRALNLLNRLRGGSEANRVLIEISLA